MQKREITATKQKGLGIGDILLIGILLAAGVVLKFFVGSMFTFVKPNFIIAMYCLIILLIRPRLHEALIIGILSGAGCQFFPGTPYINFISETLGALSMFLFVKFPIRIKKFSLTPILGTFVSTLISGLVFVGVLYLASAGGAVNAAAAPMFTVFLATVLGTALINAVIVQLLYLPLRLALKKEELA